MTDPNIRNPSPQDHERRQREQIQREQQECQNDKPRVTPEQKPAQNRHRDE
jgi:hypothetical protein